MLKILYAAANNENAKIQLGRFIKAMEGKPYIVKVAAYKKSSPRINIDWTLDCLLNILRPKHTSSNNINFDIVNKNIPFEAKIMDKGIQEMIKDGRIKSVSVGAFVNNIENSSSEGQQDKMIAKGIDFVELSLVAVPADPNAGFTMAIAESFKLKNSFDSEQEDEDVDDSEDLEEESYKKEMVNCPECDMKFSDKEKLKKHMQKKHKDVEEDEEEKLKSISLRIDKIESKINNLIARRK